MTNPPTLDRWRALVEKDLAGKPFDKTLVHEAVRGVSVQPLYTEAPKVEAAARPTRDGQFRIAVRDTGDRTADIKGGADMIWAKVDSPEMDASVLIGVREMPSDQNSISSVDPIAARARGKAPLSSLASDLAKLADAIVFVSTEPYQEAGADAVDEIAIALASGAAYAEAGIDLAKVGLRTTVGRDTFVELCKLRALRVCWAKLLTACGVAAAKPTLLHAVCSAQTLSIRDPWVNMLRVTTQMFAAITGGADIVTPNAFDQAFGEVSALGQRVARNTGLVLREESALGQVSDPAGGSYYFDSLTDSLARAAWTRFQGLMKAGGMAKVLESGALMKELEASWKKRLDAVAKRKIPILGTSEFANLDEKLPHAAPAPNAHREGAAFEALRLRADAAKPTVALVTLGSFAESRPRAGFAATFFAAGGIRTREQTDDSPSAVVCLCGTDAAYGEEGAKRVAALKAAGAKKVLIAGRGPVEGADGTIFMGCDVVASLSDVLEVLA